MVKFTGMKNKKLLPYLLAILPFVLLLGYLATIILRSGYIIVTDVTESLDVTKLYERYLYTYSDDIGESLAEKARIPLFYFIYGIFKLSALDSSYYVKIKIIASYALSYFLFVYYTKKLLQRVFHEKDNETDQSDLDNNITQPNPKRRFQIKLSLQDILYISAALGGFYYITNYWFTNRIVHFFLFLTSATLPAISYYLYLFIFDRKQIRLKDWLIALILMVIFVPTPHTALFIGVVVAIYLFVGILHPKISVENKVKGLLTTVLFLVLTGLASAYWLLPTVLSKSTPDAVLSKTITNLLSRYAPVENAIKLQGYWLTESETYKVIDESNWIIHIQELSGYAPLIILIIAAILLIKRQKSAMAFLAALLFLVGLFLASSSVLSNSFYFYIMFESSLKSIGWAFREYDKFGLLLAFVYAVAISVVSYISLKSKFFRSIMILSYILIIFFQFHFLNKVLNTSYIPQDVPVEFAEALSYLKNDSDEFNTLWYPGVPKPFWMKTGENRFVFTNLISTKPAITIRSDIINLVNYLLNEENIPAINIGKSLDMLGVKYLIIRDDESLFSKQSLLEKLKEQSNLEVVYQDRILTIFENKEYSGLVKLYNQKLVTNLGFDIFKKLDELNINTSNTLIEFTDKPTFSSPIQPYFYLENDTFIDMAINAYLSKFIYPWDYTHIVENGNADYWRKASLENLNHAESEFFFGTLGLTITQFDYGKGVVSAKNGWELIDTGLNESKKYKLSFSKHPNTVFDGTSVNYSSLLEDFKYRWNIIETDKVYLEGSRALRIHLKSRINKQLAPHFKVFSYDKDGSLLDVKFAYPDERDVVDTVVRLSKEAETFDFSIWTLSDFAGYTYQISDLFIEDVQNSVQPIQLGFKAKSGCIGNCVIYTRILRSEEGEKLTLRVNNKEFQIETLVPYLNRYDWIKIGEIENYQESLNIKLVNTEGFNSINAIVLLTKNEDAALNSEIERISTSFPNKQPFMELADQDKIETLTKINPAEYKVKLKEDASNIEIGFAKPYNKNWWLKELGKNAEIGNGFINTWYVENLEAGKELTIKHKPQEYFETGIIISAATTLATIIFVAGYTILVTTKPSRKSTSSSQG